MCVLNLDVEVQNMQSCILAASTDVDYRVPQFAWNLYFVGYARVICKCWPEVLQIENPPKAGCSPNNVNVLNQLIRTQIVSI